MDLRRLPALSVAGMSTHEKALGSHPDYPTRGLVKEIGYELDDVEYAPVEFTHPKVLEEFKNNPKEGWADPEVLPKNFYNERRSYEGRIQPQEGKVNRPRNPVGRTGMTGRGLLGKWGKCYYRSC